MFDRRKPKFGLICMAGYVSLFVVTNLITKLLTISLPLAEIAFFRYALAVPTLAVILATAPGAALRIGRISVHVARGLLAAAGSLCGYYAISQLSLGDATALFYVGPLLVTGGAALLLRERPGAIRLLCVFAGFCGVLMIAQPHAADAFGVLAGAGNALCAASGVLLVRAVRNSEEPLSLAVTTSVVCAIVLAPVAAQCWSPLSWTDVLALAALGVTGGLATVLLNTAYQSAPAAPLATIDYLAVPASLLAGTALLSDLPAWPALAGALLIVFAGITSAAREATHGLPDGSDESAKQSR